MKKMYFWGSIFVVLLALAGACSAASIVPVEVSGNPTCSALGFQHGLKFDPPVPGTYSLGSGTVTWSYDGTYVDWSSVGQGVDAIIVKGSNAANSYVYNPPVASYGDEDLVTPTNNSGKPAGLSHIDFCYSQGNNVPEFPTPAVALGSLIGIIGIIFTVKTKKSE